MAEQQFTQEDLTAFNQDNQSLDQMPMEGPEPKKKPAVTPSPSFIPEQPKFGEMPGMPATKPVKQVLPKEEEWKPSKVADLKGFEVAAETFATFEKAERGGYTTPSVGIGGVPAMATSGMVFQNDAEGQKWLQGIKSQKAQAAVIKNQEIKKLSGVAEKITDDIFGSIDDIVKQGGKVKKYIDKNVAGQDIIDQGKLNAAIDRAVEANGGGRYAKEFIRSQVNSRKDLVLSTYLERDNINKITTGAITEAQQKKFYLDNAAKFEKQIKSQVKIQDDILSKKVEGIKEKYFVESTDIGVDMNFYWEAAQQEAAKSLEGITGIYGPAFQRSFEERAKEIFDTKYAQYVMPKFEDMSYRLSSEIKQAVADVNRAVKAIYKEGQIAFKGEMDKYAATVSEQNKQAAQQYSDKFSAIVGQRLKQREEEAKGYAQSMVDISAMPGVLGAATTGKILGDTWTSAWGATKNKAALVLNSLGFEADFIDEMRYSGKSDEIKFGMEKAPLGTNWYKPGYLSQAITQSAPTMLAGMAVTALTKNPYIGGIVAFGSESIENSGGVMEKVLEDTGDLDAARAAGAESFVKNAPTVISDVLMNRMFAPIKFAKGTVKERAKDFATNIASNSAEEIWQTATELSSGKGAKLGFGEALTTREALNAGIEGGLVAGALGGASVTLSGTYKALFDPKNIPSIRTQAIAGQVVTNGPTAAMAGAQLDALINEADDDTLKLGMKEVEDISKLVDDARQIGLNPQQTQIFTAKSVELSQLQEKLNAVTDPSIRKAIQAQIAAKEKEVAGIISGETPIATIELQPGLSFTSTVDGIKNIAAVPEVNEEIAAGNVKIITDDAALNAEVEQVKTTARQRNIISDTGEVIGQVPMEAPTTEAPITQIKTTEDATKISEGQQQEIPQPGNIVQREGAQEGQPQVGQAEGGIGKATQQAADTGNRPISSQTQEEVTAPVSTDAKADIESEREKLKNKYGVYLGGEFENHHTIRFNYNNQRWEIVSESAKYNETTGIREFESKIVKISNAKNQDDAIKELMKYAEENGITIYDEKYSLSTEATAFTKKNREKFDAELAALQQAPAPAMEAAPVEDIMTLDTKDETNLQKVFNFLDNIDKQLDKFGRETAGINIALPVVRAIVKAVKALVQGGMTLQDAIKRAAADNNVSEQDVMDSITQIQEIENTGIMAGMTDEQIKERKKQERLGKVYNTPQAQQLAETAKQDATNAKTSKLTPTKAYEAVLAKVKENIDKIYKSGNYPEGVAWINMMQVAPAIARDAVNAIFPRSQKMSAMETEMVTMSARDYMRSLVSSQVSAIGQLFNNSKKMTSALKDMFKSMNETFGRGMELRPSEIGKIISEIQSVVFDKSPDLQTSMEEAAREISAIVDKGYRRKMIDEMGGIIDKINTRLKTKYSGDLVAKITNIVSILPSDWDKSNATLEDINLFNTHLRQIAKGDNTKIDPALNVLNSVTITDQQKTKSEFDKLNTKLTNLNNKVKAGTIDITGLKDLIRLQKAMENIADRKGVEGAMSAEQQTDLQQKFDDLTKNLPKPIGQLVQDKVSEVKGNVTDRVAQMKNELSDPTAELGKKIKSNDLHYQFVRMVNNYLTDDYINNLAETNPSKLVSLLSALDDIYNDGNYNNDSYLEYVSAIKYKFQKAFSEWSDNLSKNRSKFASNGVVNAFKEVARTLTDVEGGNVSPEAIKSNLTTLRIHQYDVELTGKRDEFDMGILERDLFGPMAMHQEAAMNKTQPVIEKLRDAMILYADKSNHPVIKRAINAFGSRYGVEIDVMFGKLKELTKRGFQTRLLHDVSVRMASIVNNQIDDISNLAEGDVEIDIILQRSIIGVKTDEKGKPIYSDKTMAQYYSKPGTLKLDIEQNYNKLVNAIAYAALTNNGTTTLVGLKEQQLLDLLTPKQREGIAAWREVINETESLTEAAMVITGNMNPLLKNYFPRRVQQEKKVTEIDDTESYLNGGFEYGGLANNMLKSRRGNVGALDLDGNKVLFNYIKSLNLLVEVKPFLDYVKGLKDAQQKAEAEGDLFAARYLKGIELFATEKLNAKLLQNEKSLNETFSTVFKNIAGVQSYTAKSYLISVVRQLALEYPLNVAKAGIAIAFANRSFPKQIWRLFSTNKLSLKTSKGKFEWSDYMKVVQFTGSQIARTMNLYADNYVYEYSKSPEQLQREQKLMGWQDTRPKKFLWMNRFENAFKRITGEDFDHKAFEDERGVYRNMYLTAVEKASFLADATVDKQYGSSSFTRDPLRVNLGMNPALGILTGTLVGGPVGTTVAVGYGAAGGFLSRGVRNLLNRIFKTDRALFTIKKDNEAALVTGFLQGYAGVQHASFISDMKRAMSLNSGETFKKRAELFSRGILESLLPSVGYVITRTYTGLIFTTSTAVILGIGDDEDKEEVKKNALQSNWWERQLYKTRKRFKQQKERIINDLAAGTTSVVLDPQSAFLLKMAGGLAMFKLWKEDAVEKMAEKGMTKDKIDEMKKKIKNIENIWFDIYNIRPIDIIHGEAYEKALDRYYSAAEPTKDWEETVMTITSYQEIVQTIEFAQTWKELRKNAVENKDIDKDELYSAAVLKAYSILFTLNVLGGKYGYLLSMLTGDARKVSNTMLKDLETQQLEYEIENKGKSKSSGGFGSGGFGSGGFGGGGGFGKGGF